SHTTATVVDRHLQKTTHKTICKHANDKNTRETGFQFLAVAVDASDTDWELRHWPSTEHIRHNHPPSKSTSSHPAYRKPAKAEMNQARLLHNADKSDSSYFRP
ncbi:hypothetical protein GcC1_015036, partial [Golovinomyces cichoracearum]